MRCLLIGTIPFLLTIGSLARAEQPPSFAKSEARAAVERALPLLRRAAQGSTAERECFTCHNHALPVMALTAAGAAGFPLDETWLAAQLEHTRRHLERGRENYLQGRGQGGKADTAGYALLALAAGGAARDEVSSAVVEYLLQYQSDQPAWRCSSKRPPSEASHFTTSYLALRAIDRFADDDQRQRAAMKRASAIAWARQTTPADTEDRVFRLRVLTEFDDDAAARAAAVAELCRWQHESGGWSQLPETEPDAYATATVLAALCQAGPPSEHEEAKRRAARFLLDARQDDGSWRVVSRSDPFQTYYESGFPHGEDQFISCAATAWAVIALLEAEAVGQ